VGKGKKARRGDLVSRLKKTRKKKGEQKGTMYLIGRVGSLSNSPDRKKEGGKKARERFSRYEGCIRPRLRGLPSRFRPSKERGGSLRTIGRGGEVEQERKLWRLLTFPGLFHSLGGATKRLEKTHTKKEKKKNEKRQKFITKKNHHKK